MDRTDSPSQASSAVLADRLRTGEQMIDATANLEKRERLEDFWLDLLRQYERTIDAERSPDGSEMTS